MATEATGGEGEKSHKWTPEQVRYLISFRVENEDNFTKKKYAAKQLWGKLIKELGLEGKLTTVQVSRKWENLKKKYKDLKTLKTGSGTDSGEVTAATWIFYPDMHAVLGARPSIEPPVLVASYEDPSAILMNMIEPTMPQSASDPDESTMDTSAPGQSNHSTTDTCASTSVTIPPTNGAVSRPAPDPIPSPSPKKKKKNPVLEFLKEEATKEQQRHEDSESKTDRFLGLFEKLVDKMPDKQ